MRRVTIRSLAAAALLALGTVAPASAHFLWLEPDGEGARLYFGEFAENLRESSPGLLDRFTPLPEARIVALAGEQPLKVEKSPTSFVVTGKRGATDSIVAEQSRVNERKQGDKVTRTLGHLSARYVPDFNERKPSLSLDIVPTGQPGAIKIFYKGQPLPKAKLDLISASGWKRELKADAQGAVVLPLPWRGNYVIEVEHLDATAGTLGNAAYESMRLVTTLSFRVADGAEAPPTPPVHSPKR